MRRVLGAVPLLLVLVAPSIALCETVATPPPVGLVRPEWTIERAGTGRAHVVGYLYNDNGVRHAANVWLRVEEVTAGGAVTKVYQNRIVGDILSRGRMSFDVPVAEAQGATYRVIVESVDWFMECR